MMYDTNSFPSSAAAIGTQQYAQYSTHAEIPTGTRMITGQERVQTTRKVSSTVVNEQYMGPAPTDLPVREIEVPGPIQEVIKHVPRKEVVEHEKRVPRYEYEWVERIVEVPRIEYVDKFVDVPQVQEVVREVKKTSIVDRPFEVRREVKKPIINYVTKEVQVPGEIIEIPRPYPVEQRVEVTRYTDRAHPVVVAQTVKPYIVEGSGTFEVDVYEYEPECIPVDVHVIKPVQAQIQAAGIVEQTHRVITVPAAQYNTILQQLNPHLSQTEMQKLPYVTDVAGGQITFLDERVSYTEPQPGAMIVDLDKVRMSVEKTYVDAASRKVFPVPGVTNADGTLIATTSRVTTTTSGATPILSHVSPSTQLGGATSSYNRTVTTTSGNYPMVTSNIINQDTSYQQPIPTPILAATR